MPLELELDSQALRRAHAENPRHGPNCPVCNPGSDFYVFVLTEEAIDEDGLGPTYRLLANQAQVREPVGAWRANDAHEAIRKAATVMKRDDTHFAAMPADALIVDRWPELDVLAS